MAKRKSKSKLKVLTLILILCIIGGIIGLIIYLTRRKKNGGGKTPSPPGLHPAPSPLHKHPAPSPLHKHPAPSPLHKHPAPSPHPAPKKQTVTFQIINMPSFSYPCPSPSPGPQCTQPSGFMIGWSKGQYDIGIPAYGPKPNGSTIFKISSRNLIIGAINFMIGKRCQASHPGWSPAIQNDTPCFSIWFYGSATNQYLQDICQDEGDCIINIEINNQKYTLNFTDSYAFPVSEEKGVWGITFPWRNPENVGARTDDGKWPMPKAGDKVTISITQSQN